MKRTNTLKKMKAFCIAIGLLIVFSANSQVLNSEIFSDNLNGGTLAGWSPVSGTWTNQGVYGQGTNGQIMRNDIVASNFVYEADLKMSAGYGILTFRGDNTAANGYNLALGGGELKLYTFPYAVLATSPYTFDTNTWYHLKIVANGTNIKVYFNNAVAPVIDVTDVTYSSGRFGLNAYAGTFEFDNVSATQTNNFSDNFNGGTLTGWTPISGSWTNQGVYGQGSNGQIMKNDVFASNFVYEADLKMSTGIGQLTFRGNGDASNGYNLAIGGSSIKLYTFPYAVLAEPTGYTFDPNTWYHLKVVANGTSIKVYFNNAVTPVIDVVDATFSSGRFGLNAYAGTFECDNVRAYPIFNDEFAGGVLTGWTPVSGIWSNPGTAAQGNWNGGNGQMMKNDVFATNFSYEADMKIIDPGAAAVLTFRGSNDGSSEYLVALDGGSSAVKFYRFPYAVIGTSPYTFAADTWYHLKIVANGTNFKIYFNNGATPVIDVTDATFASGKFGLNAWAGTAIFDNVKAEPLITYPDAPTSVIATAGNAQASVAFTAPVSNGGSAILDYTVTSSPGGFTATGASSPITVTGLTNTTSYTFNVKARNSLDFGASSAASVAATPQATSNAITVSSATNISALTLTPVSDIVVSGNKLTINAAKTVNSIIVAPGAQLELTTGNTLTATNGVTLQSDASGTATLVDNNTSSPQAVTATVQQYVQSGRNWYMSIPLASGASSLLSRGTSVACYDEPSGTWIAPAAGTLNKLRGYVQVATSTPSTTGTTGTVDFTGVVNTGAHSITLSRTAGKTGFNLVGNPYPSYLDWNTVTRTNVLPTMWYRTKEGGVYKFYTFVANGSAGVGSPASITNKIPPMQAFWVRVNAEGTGSIAVDNNMRAHKDVTGNIMKAPSQTSQKLLRLQVSNGTNTDETVLYFNANASDAFDQYDAPKRSNEELAIPEIYTQVGTEQLVINGMNSVKYNTEIPIGFSTLTAASNNSLSISANEMTNFENGTRVILIDKLNPSVETELTNGGTYNFSAPVTAPTTDRFSLLFRAPGVATSIDNATKPNAQVFVNAANQITIITPEKATYSIYNAMGQLIENGIMNSKLVTQNSKLATGVYIVKVANQSIRVIIK